MLSCDRLLGDGRHAISAMPSMSRSGLRSHQHLILEGSVRVGSRHVLSDVVQHFRGLRVCKEYCLVHSDVPYVRAYRPCFGVC